ncbi:MAG: hypothetical protein ACOYK6_00835 [Chthoniobacterales bacterium]
MKSYYQKNSESKATVWLFYSLMILTLAKLVLSSGEEMLGFYLPNDDLWQVWAAKRWYWGGTYGADFLYHLPIYPLFIKLVSVTGAPLRIVMELLYCFSCSLLAVVLQQIGIPTVIAGLAGFAAIFNPSSFQLPNRFGPEILLASLLLLSFSQSLQWWIMRKNPRALYPALLSSFFWALAWNVRKEALVLFPTFIVLALCVIVADSSEKKEILIKRLLTGIGIPFCACCILSLTVCSVNYFRWGLFTNSILTAPGYTAAFKALQCIRPEKNRDYIPVTVEARKAAYKVSPSFALLQDQMEGPVGKGWASFSKPWTDEKGIKNLDPLEISAGWFYWALYDSAVRAGYATTPVQTDSFFHKIGKEINTALKEKKLPYRCVPIAMIDPDFLHWFPRYTTSLKAVYNTFLTSSSPVRNIGDQAMLSNFTKKEFDAMANRRPLKSAYWAWYFQTLWESIYYHIVHYLQWIALIGIGSAIYLKREGSILPVIFLFSTAIMARILFFALLDATAWNGAQPRYLFPVMPEFSMLIILGTWLFYLLVIDFSKQFNFHQ